MVDSGRTLVVRGGTVIDGTGEGVLHEGTVIAHDGRITWVGPASDAPDIGGPYQEIDARGGTVLPGFIDVHVHMVMPGEGADPAQVIDRPPHFGYYAVLPNLRATLDAGVTTVRDLAGVDAAVQKAVDDGLVDGPRLVIAYRALSPTGGHGDFRTRSGFDPATVIGPDGGVSLLGDGGAETLRNTREVMRKGAGVVKVMASGGVMSPRDVPWHDGLDVEEMTTVVREAAAHDLPVAAHAQSASSVRNALTAGVTSVEHGYEIDERGIELLLETNAYLVPTLVTATTPPDPTREAGYAVAKKRKLQEHLSENITAAIRAGAKVALGTDSGISDHGQNLRELALLVEHGLSPEKALLAGTRDAAELLGQAERIGTLEPGKHADLVVCQGDPLTDISLLGDPDNVVLVVQGGRTVKDIREQRTAGR